ncbi:hypothetical protein HDU85_003770 [Gaertneriomyces sp. JEL0708]|nr:hypothetical protein HDU85_003770 [Gaertneriomyces sp. JEL0708]
MSFKKFIHWIKRKVAKKKKKHETPKVEQQQSRLEANGQRLCGQCRQPGHNRRTCPDGVKADDKKSTHVSKPPSRPTSGESKIPTSASNAKPQHASQPHTTTKPAASKPSAAPPSVAIPTKPLRIICLPTFNQSANLRLLSGPSLSDGPGWIYVLQRARAKSHYKIGMSASYPVHRRIPEQESNNSEKYDTIETFPMTWRFLADTVIKRQLKDSNLETRGNDGGTEWYRGEWSVFREVILRTQEGVKVMWGGTEPMHPVRR